jgi:predicted RNA binding protein YcfA (HicA-like mRNA interferase family)
MPKLPHISVLAIVKALERLGFEKLRQSGSHVVMGRNGKGCVVPMHREVSVAQQGTEQGRYSLGVTPWWFRLWTEGC